MSVGEGMGKTLGIGVLIAGAIGALWLFKDQIAGWFGSAIAAPISGAVGGVVSAAQEATKPIYEAATAPLLPQVTPDAPNVSAGEVVSMLTPGVGIFAVAGELKEGFDYLLHGSATAAAPTDTFVSAPQTIPTEADILWQAKLAEVGPVPSGPAPSGYQVRGSSLTGAPLYKPVNQMIGTIDLPDGVTGEVWQLGTSKLVKVNGMWFGENISACILKGGTWDFQKARCVYA